MELPEKYKGATRGPWHRNIKPATKYVTVWAGRNTHIANLDPEHMTDEEAEANISLIADAPMLACRVEELYAVIWEAQDIVRQHNLLSTAPESDRVKTLERFFDWWNNSAVKIMDEGAFPACAVNDNAACAPTDSAGDTAQVANE